MARLRNMHCTRLHALLLELEPGGISSSITVTKANTLLNGVEIDNQLTRHRVMIANELVDDIARLDAWLKAVSDQRNPSSKKRVEVAVVAYGTTLTDIVGVGPICAAIIIGYTGDVTRFRPKGTDRAHRNSPGVLGGFQRSSLCGLGLEGSEEEIHLSMISTSRPTTRPLRSTRHQALARSSD